MASLRELNQRRVDRMGGKGLYEEANEGVVNTLRDAIGTPVSPRKSEGGVAPTPAAEVRGAIQNTPVSQQAPLAPTLGPNAVNLPKNPYDTGFDITPRQGLRREAFGPAIANQGVTSMDRLAGQGYARRDVQGAPGVSRLTGADGRTIYTNNLEDTADWVQGGMRGGTVNTLSGPSVQEMTDRADRMRTLREGNTALRDGLGFNQGNALSRTPDRQEVIDQLLSGKSRSGRQAAAALIEGERRAELEAAKLAEETRQAGLRNALYERRIGLDAQRLKYDMTPKPMSAADMVALDERIQRLSDAQGDRDRKLFADSGLPEDLQPQFINYMRANAGEGEDNWDTASERQRQQLLAKNLAPFLATQAASQGAIGGGGGTLQKFKPGLRRDFELGDMRLKEVVTGGDRTNRVSLLDYLNPFAPDERVVEDALSKRPVNLSAATEWMKQQPWYQQYGADAERYLRSGK